MKKKLDQQFAWEVLEQLRAGDVRQFEALFAELSQNRLKAFFNSSFRDLLRNAWRFNALTRGRMLRCLLRLERDHRVLGTIGNRYPRPWGMPAKHPQYWRIEPSRGMRLLLDFRAVFTYPIGGGRITV